MPSGPAVSALGTEGDVSSFVWTVAAGDEFGLFVSAAGTGVAADEPMGDSLGTTGIGRGRYRLERASCRFHPATLMLPKAAQ